MTNSSSFVSCEMEKFVLLLRIVFFHFDGGIGMLVNSGMTQVSGLAVLQDTVNFVSELHIVNN